MPSDWLKAKPHDPWERPRIDWIASWAPFMPFWIGLLLGVVLTLMFTQVPVCHVLRSDNGAIIGEYCVPAFLVTTYL